MARFAFPAKYGMRLNTSEKNQYTIAYFTIIDTELGLEFRDVQLKQRKDGGHYVSSPYRSYEQDGETKYVNFWRASYDEDEGAFSEAGVTYLDEMTEVALAKYQSMASEKGSSRGRADKPAARKSAPARSGRGPVVDSLLDEDSELGF